MPSLISIRDPYFPARQARINIGNIAKTCAINEATGEINSLFSVPKIDKYIIIPTTGDCNGDENNLITVMSQKPSKYPTYSYNVKTKEKTCSHDGPNEELHGCSAKRRGKW